MRLLHQGSARWAPAGGVSGSEGGEAQIGEAASGISVGFGGYGWGAARRGAGTGGRGSSKGDATLFILKHWAPPGPPSARRRTFRPAPRNGSVPLTESL